MAKVDLNIVDRGTSKSEWSAEDVALTAEHLDDVPRSTIFKSTFAISYFNIF